MINYYVDLRSCPCCNETDLAIWDNKDHKIYLSCQKCGYESDLFMDVDFKKALRGAVKNWNLGVIKRLYYRIGFLITKYIGLVM